MNTSDIQQNVKTVLLSLPNGVLLEAAAKTRNQEQVEAAIHAGVSVLGYNYVQEAEALRERITAPVRWHMIGHLQKNKVKKAVELFDMIETVDSVKLARRINKQCAEQGKIMPILVEVNSAREDNKAGVLVEDVEALVIALTEYNHIRVQGLMTMGPFTDDPEQVRPYFHKTRELFEKLKKNSTDMQYLSMGMSNSYQVAIEEGANIVRLGTKLFGPRSSSNK